MSENYVTVTFTIPDDRMEEVSGALERANPEISTEADALRIYGFLGPSALEMIRQSDENGERFWVDEQMSMEEQLTPQAFSVDGNEASVEYICGDEAVEELARFMRDLYKTAGFNKVSVTNWNEHDEGDDGDDDDE